MPATVSPMPPATSRGASEGSEMILRPAEMAELPAPIEMPACAPEHSSSVEKSPRVFAAPTATSRSPMTTRTATSIQTSLTCACTHGALSHWAEGPRPR